jgi:GTP-binding protein EngB required for normal cell division
MNDQANFNTNSQKARLIDWALKCQAVCREEGDPKAAKMIEDAITRYNESRLVVAVMGLANRGKSTLINALLGRTDDYLAPIDKLPATSVTTTFSSSDTLSIEVIDRDGSIINITHEQVRDYATEEGNEENRRNVQLIRISGPFHERLKHITLVDLPGLGSIHEHHDQIVHQFLPQSDAILLLSTARMPINQEEIELLKKAREADIRKIFSAINMVDKTGEEELEQCVVHNRKQIQKLGMDIPATHKISARRAYQGEWEDSGVADLWSEIDAYIQRESGTILDRRFVSSVVLAASTVMDALSVRVSSSGKSVEEIRNLRTRLDDEKRKIEKERDIKEREFRLHWNQAIDQALDNLPAAEAALRDDLGEAMDGYGLPRVNALAKDMPGLFATRMKECLERVFAPMEERMRKLSEEMKSEFAGQSTHFHEAFTPRAGSGGLGGMLVGGSLIGGGIGIASAASAAVAASVVTVPAAGGILTAATGLLSSYGLGGLGTALASIWPTTTVAVAPSALVLLMGPVGWTLAGVGALAVPLSWGIAKKKQKEEIQDQIDKMITETFQKLKTERRLGLCKLCDTVLEEFRINTDRRLITIGEALDKASSQPRDPHGAEQDKQRLESIGHLLNSEATNFISNS